MVSIRGYSCFYQPFYWSWFLGNVVQYEWYCGVDCCAPAMGYGTVTYVSGGEQSYYYYTEYILITDAQKICC